MTGQSFRFCSGIFNYGFIAIPVALAFFQSEIVVYIILFNLGLRLRFGCWNHYSAANKLALRIA